MSVVFASDGVVVLDHQQHISAFKPQILKMMNETEEKSDHHINRPTHQQSDIDQGINSLFDDLFDLRTPFLMDGEAKKIADKMEGIDSVKAKKKKRKLDMTSGEHDTCSPSIIAEVRHVREVYEALKKTANFMNHFSFIPSSQDFRENNRKIRAARKYCTEASNQTLPVMDETNDDDGHRLRIIQDHTYIIPAKTRLICDDVQNLLQHSFPKVDLLIMDPPWWNGYVRRRNKNHGMHHGYDMLSVEDILSIPVKEILAEGSLVAIWCTNSISIIDEFLKGLKAAWDVDLCATWYWLKLSKSGAPVSSLDEGKFSHSKRPYERILLARRRTRAEALNSLGGLCEDQLHPAAPNINPPEGKIICSVPSGMHSHKPYLGDLLLPYVKKSCTNVGTEVNCLELFARSLYQGWTSYGREVLKLQHTCLFTDSNYV